MSLSSFLPEFEYPTVESEPVTSSASISSGLQNAANAGRSFVPGLQRAATGYRETEEATNTLAQLTRDQWEYYKQVGVPLEDTLYDSYRNEKLWDEGIQNATAATNAQYDAAKGNIQRQQARYGQGLSNREQEASSRGLGLSKAAAIVANRNDARKMMAETDNAVMTGGNAQSVTLKSLMG
jgi:hypothetical protein